MDMHDAVSNISFLFLARLNDVFDLTLDTWLKIAAIAILWVYVIVGPGHESPES